LAGPFIAASVPRRRARERVSDGFNFVRFSAEPGGSLAPSHTFFGVDEEKLETPSQSLTRQRWAKGKQKKPIPPAASSPADAARAAFPSTQACAAPVCNANELTSRRAERRRKGKFFL